MVIVTRVELECSYGAGDGQTRSGVVSMPKERSGRPRLDQSCDWEKHGYDRPVTCAINWRNDPKLTDTHHNSKKSLNVIRCVINVPQMGCMCLGPAPCFIGQRDGNVSMVSIIF